MATTSLDVVINLTALAGAVCLTAYQRNFAWRFNVRQLLVLTAAFGVLLALLTQ